MAYPSLDEVLSLKEKYHLIPIAETVWSDNITPTGLYQILREPYSFLLESVEGGARWARYSFIGHRPFLLFRTHHEEVFLDHFETSGRGTERSVVPVETERLTGHPLDELKLLLKKYTSPPNLKLPRFSGGAVGYFGYDAVTLFENVPRHECNVFEQDEIRLMFCDELIAFDHLRQEVTFIAHLHLDETMSHDEVKRVYTEKVDQLRKKIEHLKNRLKQGTAAAFHVAEHKLDVNWERVTSNLTQDEFTRAVETIKTHIRQGEIDQAVLSQRFSVTTDVAPFDIYRILRLINPSPYLYYLDLGDGSQVVGSSPERLVQVEDGTILVNPIAGTRRRGETEEEDERLATELLADEKERSEHQMLLELGRQDVSRVAEPDSIAVPKEMEIELFSHVMHIVSTVKGRVRPECDLIDCLQSCFPAGTVTGMPKVRAMQLIAQLEKEARHTYSGAIGYLSFSGNMDTCIAIRTLFMRGNQVFVQAGAGVVADSIPEFEWRETRSKASALLAAVQLAEKLFAGEENEMHV